MSTAVRASSPSLALLAIDPQKLLFSFSSFLAAAATLLIAFTASLPRPWWALLTVYVTAQPMAGAFRPKVFYRLGGTLTGAFITLLLVPNLQNSPWLLVVCLASWTGLCIYLAVLDRTPRAFLFQMAAFSAAVMSFPYLDDPADIFTTTISRVEEMVVAIVCVTIAHAVLQPWSAAPVIEARAKIFLAHARRWAADTVRGDHGRPEYEHRRVLAADVTELGMIAVHLPFDLASASATRQLVLNLQERLATLLPLASAAANRLDLLRNLGLLDEGIAALVAKFIAWLSDHDRTEPEGSTHLIAECRRQALHKADVVWKELLSRSLCERLAEFIETYQQAEALVARLGLQPSAHELPPQPDRRAVLLARDHGIAALAGLATAVAIVLYCAVWILLAWPNGSATAAFAALITCSFAMQDDPAPVIVRYLAATVVTFPLAALYLFLILPRVDGAATLILTLAPALIGIGYIQADPPRSALALPMFSCFIVGLGFLARFQADFALFVNTGLAQAGGVIMTLIVTKMFRSANVRWTAWRIVRRMWIDLVDLANIRRPFRAGSWTNQGLDRLGQIAARMAISPAADSLHAADGLADLRVGRNVIAIRRALPAMPHDARRDLGAVLSAVSSLYRERVRCGEAVPPGSSLLKAIDAALGAMLVDLSRHRVTTLALVGLRCNLFPRVEPYLDSAAP
jgi:uncharacterized membrane protein YccC